MLNKPYYLSLIVISAFAAVALFSIWRYILLHAPVKGKKDLGLAYLSYAMGMWAIVGLWGFVAQYFPPFLSEAVFSLLSTVNSVFYLLAVQHFDYAPEQIRRKWWKPAILCLAGIAALCTIFLSWYCFENHLSKDDTKELVNWPDVLLSFPTIFAISLGFWRSFYYRGYKLLAWLSVTAMTIVLLVQLPDVLHWLKNDLGEVEQWLTISSYALLMMFCFALSASWGVEEFSLPLPNQTQMIFNGKENRWWLLDLRIREQRFTAFLSPMAFKNLLFFVTRRIESQQNGWVHIEKDLNGSHVDLRRILLPIAEAWQESDNILKADLKTYVEKVRRTLFEYQNPGQYRIRTGMHNWGFTDTFFFQQEDLMLAMRSRSEREEVSAMFHTIKTWLKMQEKTASTDNKPEDIKPD